MILQSMTSHGTSANETPKHFPTQNMIWWGSSCWLIHNYYSATERSICTFFFFFFTILCLYWRQAEENKFWLAGLMLFEIFKAGLFKIARKSMLDFYLPLICHSVLVLKLGKQIRSYICFCIKDCWYIDPCHYNSFIKEGYCPQGES